MTTRLAEIGGLIVATDKPLPARNAFDFYPTPLPLAQRAVNLIERPVSAVLDPGAGAGVFGEAARSRWPDAYSVGVDLRDVPPSPHYDRWYPCADFLYWSTWHGFDAVIGNPPYKHAEAFVRHSWTHLRQGGEMVLLLRLAFLEGKARHRGLWREMPPMRVYVCVNRVSFTGNGRTDATAYAIFHFCKGWQGETTLGWLDWKES